MPEVGPAGCRKVRKNLDGTFEGSHAEPVMDRIVHNVVRIQMGNVSMRGMMAKRKAE